MEILSSNWGSVILLFFTLFFVATDKAFEKKIRKNYQLALISCLVLLFLERITGFYPDLMPYITEKSGDVQRLLRLFVVLILICTVIDESKRAHFIVLVPTAIGVIFEIAGISVYCTIAFYICMLGLIMCFALKKERHNDVVGVAFLIAIGIAACLLCMSEVFFRDYSTVNNVLAVEVCLFYYFITMQVYKKDRLTGLDVRHSMLSDMEANINRTYDIVLIDVDNFKLINDKYGHDKGDEALITIVNATLKNLPKGCKMYRFGGDEFVIISRKVSTGILLDRLRDTNEDLSSVDYRISYGVICHTPGADSTECLNEADKAMYENKRLLKSENIWDDMTGLYNLRGFLDELDLFRKAVAKENHKICLIAVDVERLSIINKVYGYAEGNLIITLLAKKLRNCLRGRDFIGHLGSDEFVVAVECTGSEDEYILQFITNLQEQVENAYDISAKEYSVKLNVEREFVDPLEEATSEELVNDILYIKQENKDNRRKNDSQDGDREYDDQDAELVQNIIDNNRLNYAFQPIVSAKDGSIVAYESLMRSDTEPMISPLKILKYAERSKRSYDIEKLTVFNTLQKFISCKDIPDDVKIYINAIPGHFLTGVDFELLKSKYSDVMNRIVIEITEQREMDDDSLAELNAKRDKLGFSLAIDDYGSGCSNTNNLLRYMPQVVKLDRLLITGIDRNTKKQFFVNSIISFAKENDMLTLAEGVETESELRTVVKLGVDMIQGYITAKPTIDIVHEIPSEIRDIIIKEKMKTGSSARMTYTAGESSELSVVQLAMEDYARINISADSITLTGSSEYTADMILKIMDNTDCHLTLRDVMLNSIDDRPCIELGENTNLILNIEGTNRLNAKGILVPESSSLSIIGPGVLEVSVKGHECFGIGTDSQTSFGKINIKCSGLINLNIDGEECVGIGGGTAVKESEILFMTGTVKMHVAGVDAVGVGAYRGTVPIRFTDTEFDVIFRSATGTVVGVLDGTQDIELKNYNFDINCSGTNLAVIGCPGEAKGNIIMSSGAVKCKVSGHDVCLIGGSKGDVMIDINHSNISLLGEGDIITGFGTRTENAKLLISECSAELTINASSPLAIGAAEKDIKYIGPVKKFEINGVASEIYDF